MRLADLPILEFDPSPTALIEPLDHGFAGVPERAVMCFFREVIEDKCGDGGMVQLGQFRWEHGIHPLYRMESDRGAVAIFHPGVGAPLAAGLMEEAIACGVRKLVAVGGAGALVPGLAKGHVVVPTSAVRDEGTSYHYLPAAREIETDPVVLEVLTALLREREVPHIAGKTWTTDAPYRETVDRIARRREEGCITVEMEASAFLAVARHRRVTFGQMLYAGDDVSGEAWDHREWRTTTARRDLFDLAVEAVLRL